MIPNVPPPDEHAAILREQEALDAEAKRERYERVVPPSAEAVRRELERRELERRRGEQKT